MKKLLCVFITLILATCTVIPNALANAPSQNMQAAWMASVYNIDFPSVRNNMTVQKNEYIAKLDKLKAIGINTVIVQVRPKADALYESDINPWSDVLTGTQGLYPGYDPMAFMIEEAHKRGMTFHAWLNPYRITTSGTDLNVLCAAHPARLHPDWVISYNNALYYNPGSPEVKNHIVTSVQEIVKNYDVDAIIFDDYFYPSNYPLAPGEGINGAEANDRRQSINDMIAEVNTTIKNTKTNVLFGVSPMGIWKNRASDPTGSQTTGKQSYYSFADARTWIKNGWIDYVSPQIYWETGNKAADYETLVSWWSNEVKGTSVKLYISQGIYRDVVAKQIDTQLKINQKYPEVGGSFYYNTKYLLSDLGGCNGKIAAFNQLSSTNINTRIDPSAYATQPAKIGTVAVKILNVRKGSDTKQVVVGKVTKGTKVTILDNKKGWYNVRLSNGKIGWVYAAYVKVD
ncbi:MAG: family 10 glycosylhydrolase [Chitinophagales bacterium]